MLGEKVQNIKYSKRLEKEYEDESGWGDVKRARELVIIPKE